MGRTADFNFTHILYKEDKPQLFGEKHFHGKLSGTGKWNSGDGHRLQVSSVPVWL